VLTKQHQNQFFYDQQCLISPAFENLLDDLAVYIKPILEKTLDCRLWTTYNYCRAYKKGEILVPHKDKNQCEIAVSLTLDYTNDSSWPLYMFSNANKEIIEINLDIGDALIYKGYDLLHWRNKFNGPNDQVQAFLFYATDDRFLDPFFPGIETLIKRDYEWLL
jgi:hypothetical protein